MQIGYNVTAFSVIKIFRPPLSFFFSNYYLFYFWLHWIFVAASSLSLVVVCRLLAVASLVAAPVLRWLQGVWNLPRPKMELVSSVLAVRVITAGPPGKSHT